MAPKNFVKNAACVSISLFLISMSALLMVRIHFQDQIDSQIQNISILKDIRYPNWGKNPNPSGSQYNQTFTLYNLEQIDGQIHSTKSNITKAYQYHYEYQNTSFVQGNSGRLNFINKWQLKQINHNTPSTENIKTLNLAADKIYNYDYYAPPQRKFPILYNYIVDTITGSFLQRFYTVYLYQFFFKHKQLVVESVFKPLGFNTEKATQIYDHIQLGWGNSKSFQIWVKLSLKGFAYSVQTPQYESLLNDLQLSQKQLQSLIFEKSIMQNMISALNGTIKSKLMMPGATNFYYKCSQVSCSNQQLAAFQIAAGFLTSDTLFASLNLNKGTKDLNTTFLTDIQYTRFCQKHKAEFKCMSKSNMVKFFTHNYLGDFESMDMVWKNANKYEAIERQFDLENKTGQSVVKYIQYLHKEMIENYEDVFAWAQTNYNNLQTSVSTYKNLFLVELYTRAFFNKFIEKKQVKCQDYFIGDFATFAGDACAQGEENTSWNFIKYSQSLRRYMKAYFFIGGMRNNMSQILKIPYLSIIAFFNDAEVSLFAKQIQQIEGIFKQKFGCIKNDLSLCSPQQLFCMQWGQNKIFQNLPEQIFSNKIKSINQWDTNNILNGLNPDYYAIIGEQKTVDQCLDILSSDTNTGIFNIFNILKFAKQAGKTQKNLLKYIGKNVIQINYKSIINNQDVDSLFIGFKSNLIQKKNEMNISYGGAPWLQNKIQLIKTDNKIDIKNNEVSANPQYDTIDTGIYNQDRTRQMTKLWGQSYSSSKYIVYRGTKTDDDGNQVLVDLFEKRITDRRVAGTNLLGFHPYIEEGQNLQAFISQAYQPMVLSFDKQVTVKISQQKQITAYKYSIVLNENKGLDSFIGIQQLNQNYFSLTNDDNSLSSYAIVQPITGLTIELHLSYKVKSSPVYTKFVLDSTNSSIILYSSQINYNRKGIEQVYQINEDKKSMQFLTIVFISIGVATFVLAIILVFVYIKIRNKYDTMEETLIQNQQETVQV